MRDRFSVAMRLPPRIDYPAPPRLDPIPSPYPYPYRSLSRIRMRVRVSRDLRIRFIPGLTLSPNYRDIIENNILDNIGRQ